MFYYFGRKGRAATSYPAPAYPLIIEPFAGSMAYTLHHQPAQAIGIERDTHVVALWHRLVGMTADELRDYPAPLVGERSSDRWVLYGAASNMTNLVNYRTINEFMVKRFEEQRRMALRVHDYAQRILYAEGDYRQAPDVEATWFIDPPYRGIAHGYECRAIDYDELAEWCMTRRGQVIVCEGAKGDWLPFTDHNQWNSMPMFGREARPIVEKVLVRQNYQNCHQCRVTFPANRSDARFCSAKCRKAAQRTRAKM